MAPDPVGARHFAASPPRPADRAETDEAGKPLRLEALRQRYGLSFSPLREALMRLQSERLSGQLEAADMLAMEEGIINSIAR